VTDVEASDEPALEHLRRLEPITDVALSHADLQTMLPVLLQRVHDVLGVDTVAVLLRDEATNEVVATAAKGIEEEVEQGVRIPVGKGFAGRIVAQRRPIYRPDVRTADVVNPILREKGIASMLGVPLVVRGEAIGVLHVGSLTPREFTEEETTLLEQAAARIAPAIAHARLLEAERGAREDAERAVAELTALQELSDAALAHLEVDEMLQVVLDRLRTSLQADTAAILLLDPESDELVARSAKGIEEEVERGVRVPVGKGFAGRIAATREVVTVPRLDEYHVENPILREKGIISLLGAPLVAGGEVRGVLHVGTLVPREFSQADVRLLQLAADRIATALEHSRLINERNVVLTLQETLLPERLPDISGLTLAASYRPGEGGLVGGDWYDAVPLQDGSVALAIGDVVSRGLRAAGVMSQLRHALRMYAIEGAEPAELVEKMATLVRTLERREVVTLAYVVIDPTARELCYVLAGHPPPVLVQAGTPLFLEEARGAPLGAVAHPRYTAARMPMAPDSLLVLYTDGLVEQRRRTLGDGLDQLTAVVRDAGRDPHDVVARLTAELVDEETEDDVALLVARTADQRSDHFELRLPAIVSSLASLRRTLRQWLRENGADEDDEIEVLIALGEAAGNAVEHAYGPGDAVFDVIGSVKAGVLDITVRDYGHWRPPRGQNRGRGTLLMQQLMDGFEVRTTSDGTEVRLRRALGQGSRA
jgi:serine phosphatase RsbU (regulator of sigma subunit)/putative methionine-R-sulfoxide reductase with GAF domain/anti-sigma regulatory factor (Ser/Thr protein kinase)